MSNTQFTSVHHLKIDPDGTLSQSPLIEQGSSYQDEPSRIRREELPGIQEITQQEAHSDVRPFMNVWQEQVRVSDDLVSVGVISSTPTQFTTTTTLTLPLSDENIYKALHKPVNLSLRWFAEWALNLLKRAHISLKKLHGHIIRIVR